MKFSKSLFYIIAAFAISSLFVACSKDDDDDGGNNQTTKVELVGNLTTRTLTADKKYLIKGQVFVGNGQTLTIEPGTVIFGDKATRGTLIIDKGGKIIAEGTKDKPIVFTSALDPGVRDRGDWGGIVILGRANVNQVNPAVEGITPEANFGTTNSTEFDNESSGVLKYVRVEFAGIELTPNNETNSITLGGIGRGTVVEYCQVSFGGDDGFEWFGGTVNCKYLISSATWDDDFDVDYGYAGNVQFGLALRYPGFADQSQSNGFETDNGPNDNDVQPYTNGVFSNITILGPILEGTKVSNGNFGHGIDLRRRTALSVANSFVGGFPKGVRMNQASVLGQFQNEVGVLFNNILWAASSSDAFVAGSGVNKDDVEAYWNSNKNKTKIEAFSPDGYRAYGINPDLLYGKQLPDQYPSNPNFTLTSGGTLSNGADFSHSKFSEPNRSGFFQNVPFIGAVGSEDWTDGWAEFNPITREY